MLGLLLLAALALAAAGAAYVYVASPAYPFGFYGDLGTNIAATANIDAAIVSLRDLADALGWAPWDNGPAFAFNPMGSYAVLVPIAKLAHHDAAGAVKCTQLLQFVLAWAGAAGLYVVVAGRFTVWAAVLGTAYALAPQTALQIRGNVDFGFATALAPAALALSLAAVDRIGMRALPLAGVLCGASSWCFAIEYFLLTSLAMYAICALRAFRRSFAWPIFAALGLACASAAGAFVVLPSLGAGQVYRDPVSRIAELYDAGLTRLFSETFVLVAALVPKEAAISPTPELNVSSSLGILAPAAVLFAVAALSFAAIPGNLRAYRLRGAAAVLVICLYLSLGSNAIFGDVLWGAISRTPGLQLLRTPDRFIALPSLLVPLFAVLGFAQWYERLRTRGADVARGAIVVALGLACTAAFGFDAREHVLELERASSQREPGLRAANAAARRLGGRTIPLAFVKAASSLDSPLYGAGLPFERFGWDVTERFGSDGVGASGIFSRAAVHGIIASPNWTIDAPLIPDYARMLAGSGGMHRAAEAGGVSVFALDWSAPDVRAVRTACFAGDVGLFDRLLAVPQLRAWALLANAPGPCDATLQVGSGEPEAPRGPVLGLWPGASFVAPASTLRDADYPFIVGRNLLAASWYRDTIDGDETWFGSPAAQVGPGFLARLPPADRPAAAAELLLRVANHCLVEGSVAAGPRHIAFTLPARIGLHWVSLPLGALAAGSRIALTIASSGADAFPAATWHGVALDAIALRDERAPKPSEGAPLPAFVAFDPGRLARRGEFRVSVPRGAYTLQYDAPNGAEGPLPVLAFDGKRAVRRATFLASGARGFSSAATSAGLLLLVPAGALPALPAPAFERRSAASWQIDVAREETLEAAVVDDGNWELVPPASAGIACDLVNTCFPRVPAGRYLLRHRWPKNIILGLAISTLALASAVAFALPGGFPARRFRGSAAARRAAAR